MRELKSRYSKKYDEIYTADEDAQYIISRLSSRHTRILDLCAGLGTFAMNHMLLFNNPLSNYFFNEIQISNSIDLIEIFGDNINLFVGDAHYLTSLPHDATGVWVHHNGWRHVGIFRNEAELNDLIDKTPVTNGSGIHFDLVMSNPPYSKTLHLKLFNKINSIGTEWLMIHPDSFIHHDKSYFRLFKDIIYNYVLSIEFDDPKRYFNIMLSNKIAITHIDFSKSRTGPIKIMGLYHVYNVSCIRDVSRFEGFAAPVKELYNKLSEYDSILNHMIKSSNTRDFTETKQLNRSNVYPVQLANIATQQCRQGQHDHIVPINHEITFGCRKTSGTIVPPTWVFNDPQHRLNFIKYLQTDFARLAANRKGVSLHGTVLRLVPWLDFSREWTNDQLFDQFVRPQFYLDCEFNQFKDFIAEYLK
jgi:hypothetical protein